MLLVVSVLLSLFGVRGLLIGFVLGISVLRIGRLWFVRGLFAIKFVGAVRKLFGLPCEAIQFEQIFLQLGKLLKRLFDLLQLLRGIGELLFSAAQFVDLFAAGVLLSLFDFLRGGGQLLLGHVANLLAQFVEQRVSGQLIGELFAAVL